MENGQGLFKMVFQKDLSSEMDLPDQFAALHVSTDEVCQYLQRLSTLGVSRLGKEVDRIAEEKASIISQTQELAFQEYPTFIETAQCTQDIFQSFQKVNQSTDKLTSNLTILKDKCLEFSKTAHSLSAARRLTSIALSRHTQLLEILELPQLMDTCVRNGYWEEALELAAYVSRVEKKLGDIPLVVKVAQEVQSCTRLMLSQLIAQLRMPAQLPHCLKVVGYLKRMGVFSEEELRLKFLSARDAWFKTTLEEIPKDDAYQHILKTVELSRVHLLDIAIQYRAIFTDEDPLVLANQDPNTNASALFHTWIVQKVTDFLATLQTDLPKVSPSSLESVFGQCMYFGLSFGRIGSDFRCLMVPIFAQVVNDRFEQAANQSESRFADAMASFSFPRTGFGASNLSGTYVQPLTADQIQPPYTLIKFTPLAELCNGLIAAFNEMRLCAAIQLAEPIARKLGNTLHNCSQILADFQRQEKEAFTKDEEADFLACLELLRHDFLPYVQKVLQLLFTSTLLCSQTGFPVTEISRQDPGHLDTNWVLQPVAHLLPKEPEVRVPVPAVDENDIGKDEKLSENEEPANETVADSVLSTDEIQTESALLLESLEEAANGGNEEAAPGPGADSVPEVVVGNHSPSPLEPESPEDCASDGTLEEASTPAASAPIIDTDASAEVVTESTCSDNNADTVAEEAVSSPVSDPVLSTSDGMVEEQDRESIEAVARSDSSSQEVEEMNS